MSLLPAPPEDASVGEVDALMRNSLEHYHRHRYREAHTLLEEALDKSRSLGDRLLESRVLGNLANTCK